MSKQETFQPKTISSNDDNLKRVDHDRFTRDLDLLITESEDMRLDRMRQHRMRGFVAMNLCILSVLIGVFGFGWFFLMKGQITPSIICLIGSVFPCFFINVWAARPLKIYLAEHKTVFLPKLAKTLNGFEYYPHRGVRAKIIERLAVIPAHEKYEAEDCFMGCYKGVNVIFSEARLYAPKQTEDPIFDGIFVLLENPEEVFEGHTIITANHKMVKAYEQTRWKDMKKVHISVSNPDWDKFEIYSTKPESAELYVGEKLLKELAEASEVFDKAPLTAVMFGKRFVFLMIPYAHDMFEPSSLFVPVTTKTQAHQVKKEIEQLLEIIDVFDLYKPIKS